MPLPPLESLLACPVDGSPLRRAGDSFVSDAGRTYPIIQGVPVVIDPDTTDPMAARSLRAARDSGDPGRDPFYVDTLDVDDSHRPEIENAVKKPSGPVDPIVSQMVAATCGNLYRHLVGRLPRYPIPNFRLTDGSGKLLLDIGCNWGRWCFAAARERFMPVGIDPQLGAVLAAKRVAAGLGIEALFVCGDARQLPFRAQIFDVVFSYSVLQHLSTEDVQRVLGCAAGSIKPSGEIFVEMATKFGLRNLLQQARRGFRPATGFEVRYWSLSEIKVLFAPHFNAMRFEVDCFLGIGLQPGDADLLPIRYEALIAVSEGLRRCARRMPVIRKLADSIYIRAGKPIPHRLPPLCPP